MENLLSWFKNIIKGGDKRVKRTFIALAIAFIMTIVWSFPVAAAAKEGNVVVTATGAFMAITVTPTTYDFGVVDAWVIADTVRSAFSVNSTSSITIDVLVSVTTWTSGGSAWTYSTQGWNSGMLAYSADTGLYTSNITNTGTSYNLTDTLAAATGKGFELRLFAPADFADGSQNSINITLAAYRA